MENLLLGKGRGRILQRSNRKCGRTAEVWKMGQRDLSGKFKLGYQYSRYIRS